MELTLFEVHLDDASFSANAPFSGQEESGSSRAEPTSTEDEGGSSIAPLVVGLVVLGAVAFGVRRMMRGDSEGFEPEVDAETEAEVHA